MIDFEKEFQSFISVWMKREGLSQSDYDMLDNRLAEIYDEWLKMPSELFGNKTPGTFFDDIDNPFSLVRMLKKYVTENVTVPGPLLNRLLDLKEGVYPLIEAELSETAGKSGMQDVLNSYYIELIREMRKPHPIDAYISALIRADERLESLEAMIDVLKNDAANVKEKVKAAYLSTAYEYAKDSFVDILSELPGDDDAYKFALECFIYDISKCGMYAHMLSKIGNPACLAYLEDRLNDPTLNYFNFCRVKEALEELGGETSVERDFVGDEDYEFIAELNEETDDNLLDDEEYDIE